MYALIHAAAEASCFFRRGVDGRQSGIAVERKEDVLEERDEAEGCLWGKDASTEQVRQEAVRVSVLLSLSFALDD